MKNERRSNQTQRYRIHRRGHHTTPRPCIRHRRRRSMIHHAPSPRLEPDHQEPDYDESDIAFLQTDVDYLYYEPLDTSFSKSEEKEIKSIIKGEPT